MGSSLPGQLEGSACALDRLNCRISHMRCPNGACGENVPAHRRICPVCGADAGCPNVRAASQAAEIAGLELRCKEQEEAAERGDWRAVLREFEEAVAKSVAVVCRPLAKVHELVSSDNELFATFYQLVGGEARLPEDNEWDRLRQAADSLLFPYYHEDIRFACLSLDGLGVSTYGGFCITLKDGSIRDRASVFEGNSLVFLRSRRLEDPIPVGHRAPWAQRGRLGVAKLGGRLGARTQASELPGIVVDVQGQAPEFIEVHIFGPLHRRAVARVVGMTPPKRQDKVLLKALARKLQEVGAVLEIHT